MSHKSNNGYWKERYDRLREAVDSLADESKRDHQMDIPEEPISQSNVLFIANNWEITDNEKYAKDHWSPGQYQRWVPESKVAELITKHGGAGIGDVYGLANCHLCGMLTKDYYIVGQAQVCLDCEPKVKKVL
jgi:hypothetical protein